MKASIRLSILGVYHLNQMIGWCLVVVLLSTCLTEMSSLEIPTVPKVTLVLRFKVGEMEFFHRY